MNFKSFIIVLTVVVLCSLILIGCEEQTARSPQAVSQDWFNQAGFQKLKSPQTQSQDTRTSGRIKTGSNPSQTENPALSQTETLVKNNKAPKMTFEQVSHDFGKIKPGSTNNVCEFVFKNTGNDNLIISEIENSCSCTLSMLENDKKEYAPGESGKILAGYTDTQLGQIIKHIYISSNDPENPKMELAIKAELVAPIDYEPKKLELSLLSDNAGCPKIVVKSLDNKPFSITGFQATGDCITVKLNPQEKATQFVLEPKVDMTKLRNTPPDGSFKIFLSHPDCELVSGTYYTPPRFSVNPQMISISQADPKKSIIKTINILSNYNENFSIQTSGNTNIVNILETRKTRNGYQVTVEVKPPVPSSSAKMFTDNIKIALKGIGIVDIPCHGYYPGATVPQEEKEKECKTCGPTRVDMPSMSFNPK